MFFSFISPEPRSFSAGKFNIKTMKDCIYMKVVVVYTQMHLRRQHCTLPIFRSSKQLCKRATIGAQQQERIRSLAILGAQISFEIEQF